MRRIFLVYALVLVLLSPAFSFAAGWRDGTYEGWSDAGPRSIQYAKVFIQDGEIAGVILREYTDRLVEKDWTCYDYPPFGEAARTLGTKFVEAQLAEIDAYTGATGSSTGWMQAVERALKKAGDAKKEKQYFDGTFLGRSEVADRGYYEVVWVTVENDKITGLQVQRVLADLSVLDPDTYEGFPLEMARQAYAQELIGRDNADVDAISGATGLTNMLNIAVRDALDRASTK